jgi:hypothetical protein
MATSFNKANTFVQDLGRKVHNLNSDTLKIALSNTAAAATMAVLADITEISAGNGYSAGGVAMGSTSWAQAAGVAKLTGANVTFTASGGSIGPFQYVWLYNSTASGGPLIGWWNYATPVTITDGNFFEVLPSDLTDILQIT